MDLSNSQSLERERGWGVGWVGDREGGRQRDRETYRDRQTETDRQTDRQTETSIVLSESGSTGT